MANIYIRRMMTKLVLTVLTVILLPALSTFVPSANLAAAYIEEVRWCPVGIPTEGESSGWVLASGTDMRHLTRTNDGTLYCYASPTGIAYRLFKSTNEGRSWWPTGGVQDTIIDIASMPDNPEILYYATGTAVYKSTDAGAGFTSLPPNPGGSGSNNIVITSIDIVKPGTHNLIAVGTRDNDAAEFGGVFILDENDLPSGWVDTAIGDYDVSRVAFSPGYAGNGQLLAVATDETDSYMLARITGENWGDTINAAVIPGVAADAATIAFPDDYQALAEGGSLFAAIDTGNESGDVYRIDLAAGSLTATDLDIGAGSGTLSVDVTSLEVNGTTTGARLLAGAAGSAGVYISTDAGLTWTAGTKNPTGQSATHLLTLPDFAASGRACAITCGTDSAFSYTEDGGATWNQVSLIDTSVNIIKDVAISPLYNQDTTLFLLTLDTMHTVQSLWRSVDDGITWERLLSSSTAGIDELRMVEFSGGYSSSNRAVFLAGTANGNPAVWKSTDNGQTFTPYPAPVAVAAWVSTDETLFIAGFDGTDALVYRFDGTGYYPPAGVPAGNQPPVSLAVSPDFTPDETVLMGNIAGQVYRSQNGGTSFSPLGQPLPVAGGSGEVSVSFHPAFCSNMSVYATSSAMVGAGDSKRIFRYVIGRDTSWQAINGTLPDNASVTQVKLTSTGTLYAINSQPVNTSGTAGGMERSVNPTFPLSQTFETVVRGLDSNVTLDGLWSCGNRLWSVDSQNTRLLTFIDTMCTRIVPGGPAHHAPGIDIYDASIFWGGPPGVTEYQWQIDYDGNFSSVPDGFEGKTAASSVHLPVLQPGTTYYWRVRACKPVLSPWSPRWSFTTVLGRSTDTLELLSPKPGTSHVSQKPVFQWSEIEGAEEYELLISTDILFNNPVVRKDGRDALPATAWQSDTALDYDTTYYWKVRGCSPDSFSNWSAVSAFTTGSEPPLDTEPEPSAHNGEPAISAPPEQSEPSLPVEPAPVPDEQELSPVPQVKEVPAPQVPPVLQTTVDIVIPEWVSHAITGLLASIVLLLIALLIMVIKIKRF